MKPPCSECLVLLEMLRTIRAHCDRKKVQPGERERRLRWAAETFEKCCLDAELRPMGDA
jgi:hypothetical protein